MSEGFCSLQDYKPFAAHVNSLYVHRKPCRLGCSDILTVLGDSGCPPLTADEAMGYLCGQEDPSTEKGRLTLLRAGEESAGAGLGTRVCGRGTGTSSEGCLLNRPSTEHSKTHLLCSLLKGGVFTYDFTFPWAILTHAFRMEETAQQTNLVFSVSALWFCI